MAAQVPPTGGISGIVLETRDGAPVSKVLVRLQESGQSTTTDESGRFVFTEVSVGSHELYVSAVDFILVKQLVQVAQAETTEVTIVLAEGVGNLEQSITVTERMDNSRREENPSVQRLRGSELQQMRGLVTNDPFRAIQVLPGVAAGDDLRSEFTVRGHGMDHIAFTFEGIAMPLLVHTVQRIVDTGSIAMINGDVLDEVSLLNGAHPQRYGDRLGAELDFRMREGSRERTQARLSVTGTDSALIGEGPLGGQRGSWLFSVRKSYFDLITSRIENMTGINFTFGFVDAQGKAVYDINATNQVQFAIAGGRSRLNLNPEDVHWEDPEEARNSSAVGIVSWRHTFSPRSILTQRFAIGGNRYGNLSPAGVELARGSGHELVYRSDLTAAVRSHLAVESGAELHASTERRIDRGIVDDTRVLMREQFDQSAVTTSGYIQARVSGSKWTVTPGVRADHWTLTGETTGSPWLQASVRPTSNLTIHGGAGIARQRPTMEQLVGIRGTPDLETERAVHEEIGLDGPLGAVWHWAATVYRREERDIIRLPNAEFRVIAGELALPSFTTHYRNGVAGHARGVELVLERRSVNGFNGWISYAYGRSQYRDEATRETFWADNDQRHTLNAYSLYRINERFSVSGRFRSGSNFPTPGYWEARNGAYFVSQARNDLRVAPYARLDLRVNRTFVKRNTRLTLFGEVLNVLDRRNVRAAVPGVNRGTFEATGLYDPLFPRVPSAGLLLEF